MEKIERTVATVAGEIVLPVSIVELTGRALRRKDGKPILIGCDYIDEDRLVALIEAVPGHSPVLGVATKQSNTEAARGLMKYGPTLISASCFIVGDDGSEQRPAFHWGPDPGDGSLPGRYLTAGESLRLILTILKASGFIGGPADNARFRDGKREGSTPRKRSVASREGNGKASLRTRPR